MPDTTPASSSTPSGPLSGPPSSQDRLFWFQKISRPILFLIISLALVGGYLAFSIPVSVFPSTDFPRVVIGVDNGVMPIDQMLVTITRPIEDSMNNVPGLQRVVSITSRGSAEVDLFFDWQNDMVLTLQRVDAVVARLQSEFPSTAKVETHRLTFATFPIIGYSLTSDTLSPDNLWEIATYDIKPRINRLDGVAAVIVQGGRVPEYQITPDPARLVASGITVADILDAVRRTNLIDSPGLFEHNHQLVLGLVSGQVHSPAELGQIVVKNSPAGVPLRVTDIASVARSVAPVYTMVKANGKSAVLLSVDRQPESNTLAVADEVHRQIQALQPALPPGLHLEPFYDQSTIVRDSISSVRDAVLIGILLSVVIIILFLRDWGASLIAGLVIPATLLITCIALKFFGQSFNLMTLGGLAAAVGLVIDDAIVVLENIILHRDAGQSRFVSISTALRELFVPLLGSTITPIVVFLPLISIAGVTGSFFRALAITMTVALLVSLFLALTWTPTLSQFFLRQRGDTGPGAPSSFPENVGPGTASSFPENVGPGVPASFAGARASAQSPASPSSSSSLDPHALLAAEEKHLSGFFGRIVDFYTRAMQTVLRHPLLLVGSSAAIILLAALCYWRLETDLMPEMDEGSFILDYWTPPGSSLTESDRILRHFDQILKSTPEVENTSRRTGLELGLAAVTEANRGDYTVRLKKKRDRAIDDVMNDVREEINKTEPSSRVEFVQILGDMIGDLSNEPEPVVINLFSQDSQTLLNAAPRVADAISKVNGVVDVLNGVENTISGPASTFQVNALTAARSGFTPEEISIDASAILEGEPAATPVILNDRVYPIRVRFPDSSRASLDQMMNTPILSATGRTATLGSLAVLNTDPGQTEIRRENSQRYMRVTARLEGVGLGSGMAAVQKAVGALHLPSSIRVEYGGTFQEQQKSFRDLLKVLFLALLLLFIVLLFEFRTFSAPAAILASALLSTFGGLFALLITRTTFNIASFMGIIMVVGIVAKNGILLLDADQRFRSFGFSPEEAMIQAGRRRLRPIAMTALATVAGMFPLAFGLGAGSEMLKPLAITVIGGLLSSMVLSLVFTPAIHYRLHRSAA